MCVNDEEWVEHQDRTLENIHVSSEEEECYELTVYVPNNFTCRNSTPQSDGIWRWGLWEVISVELIHEGGVLMMGLVAL